ncbi:NAD(+)/NADH kinase [Pseudonocardia humida]|uniref:NAD kinase n=1 Tax=Pseudonocardia humida TaxID=2800819 RepID=A0ABT1A437_9PSEU|nr:NAD(+)/NADH kinase [Pseudonocardia humida]MCO1657750.1 NAD(+)/NADH kinase [Pseudonocardia humida]
MTPSAPDLAVGLVLHPRNDVSGSLDRALAWARSHDVGVLGREVDRARLPDGVAALPDADFARRVKGVLSLGGDGTMLGALRLVADRPEPVPVLGVNHGNLGFLTEVSPAELEGALARLVAGEFSVESRGALRVDDGDGPRLVAFNDMVLRGTRGAMSAELVVGADHFGRYRADALIVATPTGSTAYNYAAGGPVVSPSAQTVVVTPVAPMSGISRALVLGPDEPVVLRPDAGHPATLEADGAEHLEVPGGSAVRIDYVPDAAHIVRFDPARHARRNRVQLSLLDLPLRPDQLLDLVPAHIRAERGLRVPDPPQ